MIIEIYDPKSKRPVLYEIETDSEEAWKEAYNSIRNELKILGISLSDNEIYENFQQALLSYVESYQGDYPETAILSGWHDVYEGEPSPKLKTVISKAIEKSHSLNDLINELYDHGYKATIIYDQYYENCKYFFKQELKDLKKK